MLNCYPARLTNSHWIASVLHASLDLGEHRGNRGFWDINVDFVYASLVKAGKAIRLIQTYTKKKRPKI